MTEKELDALNGIGLVTGEKVDWREELSDEPDEDDDEGPTDPATILVLGFDPQAK